MSESFYDGLIITRKEYDRKMRAEYDRGYQDGLSKRDTETWQLEQERAVAIQRLKEVLFDGLDSHHNLSAIANAVWGATPVAWTKESCMALARRLMWLLGAEDEPTEPTADELRVAIAFGLTEAGLEDLGDKFDRLMQLVDGEDG